MSSRIQAVHDPLSFPTGLIFINRYCTSVITKHTLTRPKQSAVPDTEAGVVGDGYDGGRRMTEARAEPQCGLNRFKEGQILPSTLSSKSMDVILSK